MGALALATKLCQLLPKLRELILRAGARGVNGFEGKLETGDNKIFRLIMGLSGENCPLNQSIQGWVLEMLNTDNTDSTDNSDNTDNHQHEETIHLFFVVLSCQ